MPSTKEREAGFTLISMLIVVAIIGVLATIAVPKFNSVMASANTAKVKADLSAIDSAIAVYELDYGKPPRKFEDLQAYIDTETTKPPKGKCNLKNETKPLELKENGVYTVNDKGGRKRALCEDHTAEEFGK